MSKLSPDPTVSEITLVLGKNDLRQADNSGFVGVNHPCESVKTWQSAHDIFSVKGYFNKKRTYLVLFQTLFLPYMPYFK